MTNTQINPGSAVAVAVPVPAIPTSFTMPVPVVATNPAASSSGATITQTSSGDLASGILEFPKTAGGNTILDLGDEDLDEDHFATMLMEYNNTIPADPTPHAAVLRRNATPVLYNEPSEDAQNDANFYSAMVDFDPFMSSSTDLSDFFDFQAASLQDPGL